MVNLEDEPRAMGNQIAVILRGVADGITAQDPTGRVVYANDAAVRILGFSSVAALLATPTAEVMERFVVMDEAGHPFPPDKLPGHLALQGVPEAEAALCFRRAATGEDRWAIVKATPVFDEHGQVQFAINIFHDITERRQAEAGLRLLAAIAASSDDAIMTKDMDDRITTWNPGAERLYGYTAAEMIGQPSARLVPPERLDEMTEIMERLGRGERVEHFETVRRRKDGSPIAVSVSVSPLKDAAGRQIGASAIARDITERAQAEEALHRFAAIVASSDAIILSMTTDGIITSWNPGAERHFGYTAPEAIGQPITILHPPDRPGDMPHLMARLRRGERFDHFETVRVRKDGRHIDVSLSIAPIKDAAGRVAGVTAIGHDITERKRTEREASARARQQAAMAALRQQVLASTDVATLLDETAALVARTLDVELCAILEPLPDGAGLRLRAGVGWGEGLVGQAAVGLDCPAGDALRAGEPVIVADLRMETRFEGSSLLHAHEVVSGVSLIMGGPERPVGVLEVHTTRPRLFSADEVHFLRAVANLLATVSVRTAAEEALRVSERRYRAIFEQSPSGLILYAPNGLLLDVNQTVLGGVPREQAAGYNVLADQRFVAEGVMDDIRRAFAGEAVRLPPLPANLPRGSGPHQEPARWMRASLYPIKDEAGSVREVMALAEDVTEQVQAYQLLEQRVAERTQELATLLAVSHHVASTLELQPLLALILDHLRTVVDYTAAEILLLEGEYLVSKEYRGPLSRDQVVHLRFPATQAVGYQEIMRRGGDPVIVDDLWGDTPLARAIREGPSAPLYAIHAYFRSFMVVPLMVKERIIGVVVKDHDAPQSFTPQHAALALAIANQAAVAIENARLYARAQEVAALEERARLARELHDSVTQMLFSAGLIADVLPRLWESNPAAGQESLDELRLLTRGALAEMRTLLLELRPTAIAESKLGDLLQQLADVTRSRKRLAVLLTVEGARALPPDVQIALYRIAQEALTNVARHAGARKVTVRLHYRRRAVALAIGDDGRGFDPSLVPPDHFGLRIMRERVEAIGAALTIDSAPGHGTRVTVTWKEPRARRSHDDAGTYPRPHRG